MKFYPLVITILICHLGSLNAQQLGDYRSTASGNWTSAAIWETYNGVGWIAATSYPGQNTGTNNVNILGGNSVTITSTILNSVNSLTIGDGTGATDNFYIGNTASLITQLVTVANGGFVKWTANVSFYLPAGAAFKIDPGGVLSTDKPCSAGKRLVIGATIYSTCNGGAGADYSFTELEDEGGSLSVTPTSNGPICEGALLNLYANPSGAGSSGASFLWTGSNGFTSSSINPVVAGLNQGNYTFSVTISDSSGNTHTNSVAVTVSATPSITATTPGSRTGPGTVLLNATASSGVLDWFSNSSGGTSLGSGSSFMTPSIASTTIFYVEASENGCISNRTAVTATINGVTTVISNRKITFRTKVN